MKKLVARSHSPISSQEDRVQETRLRLLVLTAAGRLDPAKGPPDALAAGIARNVAREAAKKDRRDARTRTLRIECRPAAPDPLEAAIVSETLDRVRDAMDEMEPTDVELIKRRFGLAPGCSAPLTADERCRLCRAMKRLRELLWKR